MDCDKLIIELLPALRSMSAKKMSNSGMTQKAIAEKLNITQPAVSQYKRERRGGGQFLEENPEIRKTIEMLSTEVAKGKKNIKQATVEVVELALEISNNK